MAEKATADSNAPMNAEQLRMRMLEAQMKEMERAGQGCGKPSGRSWPPSPTTSSSTTSATKSATMIRRLVKNAVEKGQLEALVYSFPSDLCTDGGRAINNADPDWPETLQGKAKEMYDAFKARVQPQGYRLKAMIINFPGGVPGDVGFFLNWAPPVKRVTRRAAAAARQNTSGTTLRKPAASA